MVKGVVGPLNVLFMGTIVLFIILLVGIAPTSSVKLRLDKETGFEYMYNKAQHILLDLFFITSGGKKVSQTMSERYLINKPSDLEFLKENLDKQIGAGTKCYQIKVSGEILLSSAYCIPSAWTNSTIVLPYNLEKLVEEISVGV